MSAWGAAAKSCDKLLKRVEENDPSLVDLVILPSKIFSDDQVQRLACALSSNTHLASLSASGHEVSSAALRVLGSKLPDSSTFVKIAIGKHDMGDEGVQALLEAGGGHLKVLDLGYKNIGMGAIRALPNPFQTLTDLNLSRNSGISNDEIETLSQIECPNLMTLNLSECCIGSAGIEALASTAHLPELKILNLNSNSLGKAAGQPLSVLLKNLHTMNLSGCGLGTDGVRALSQQQPSGESTCCKILDLSDNNIGREGAVAFAQGPWSHLQDLSIAKNPLQAEGVTALLGIHSLLALDVSETDCGPDGASNLVGSKTLKRLRLFDNNLGSPGFEAISAILPNATLEGLDLGGNRAPEAAVIMLLEALRGPTIHLKVLELGGNKSTEQTLAVIAEIQAIHPDLDIAKDRPAHQENDSGPL